MITTTLFGIERDGRIIDTAATADLAALAALAAIDAADATGVPLGFYAVVEVCGDHPDMLANECPEHGDDLAVVLAAEDAADNGRGTLQRRTCHSCRTWWTPQHGASPAHRAAVTRQGLAQLADWDLVS